MATPVPRAPCLLFGARRNQATRVGVEVVEDVVKGVAGLRRLRHVIGIVHFKRFAPGTRNACSTALCHGLGPLVGRTVPVPRRVRSKPCRARRQLWYREAARLRWVGALSARVTPPARRRWRRWRRRRRRRRARWRWRWVAAGRAHFRQPYKRRFVRAEYKGGVLAHNAKVSVRLNVADFVGNACTAGTATATGFKVGKVKPGVDSSIVFRVEDEHSNVAVGEVPRPLFPNTTAAAAAAAALRCDSEGRECPRVLIDCNGFVVHYDAVAVWVWMCGCVDVRV